MCLRVLYGEQACAQIEQFVFLVHERFAQDLAALGTYTQTGSFDFALLMQEDSQSLSRLTHFALYADREAQTFGMRLSVGISDVFTSVSALHTAFLRAQFALRPVSEGQLSIYAQGSNEVFGGMKIADLGRLHHLLISWTQKRQLHSCNRSCAWHALRPTRRMRYSAFSRWPCFCFGQYAVK